MFHDLSVPWTKDRAELQRTVAFLDECKRDCPCFNDSLYKPEPFPLLREA